MDVVDVDGRQIAYRRAGNGPPLVLLHGAPGDGRMWRTTIDDLADAYTVIAWDTPGCGESSDPPETWRMGEYADCLDGFLIAIGCERAHVVGHSWGSSLALEHAHRYPERATTLLLAGGYAGWAGSLPPEEVATRLAFALDVADQLPDRWDPRSMFGLFSDVMPADRADELAAILADSRAAGFRPMARALAEADQRDILGDISVPVLLLYGEDDQRSPVSAGRALDAAIPDAQLVILPGLGHLALLEDRAAFAREVRRFLSAHTT